MPTYEYTCPACGESFEVFKAMSRCEDPEACPKCEQIGDRQFPRPSVPNFVLKGDGWAGKAIRVKGQMKSRRETLAQKERDHVAPPMTLKPNVGGEETGTWSEAKKLAGSKGKDTSSYEPLVQKETRGDA